MVLCERIQRRYFILKVKLKVGDGVGVNLKNDWNQLLEDEFKKDYYLELREFLKSEYRSSTVYPEMSEIFSALEYTSYSDTRVLILGQDPYHGENQAHGLSFSVKKGVATPPSLRNIYKELSEDLGCYIPNNGYLKKWADQGVLLLNAVLTVRGGEANSHRSRGWEKLTDRVIELLSERQEPMVFILWGNNARAKKSLINTERHLIIESAHPSPLSAHRGFFGSKPFSRANEFLNSVGREPIDWQIENI